MPEGGRGRPGAYRVHMRPQRVDVQAQPPSSFVEGRLRKHVALVGAWAWDTKTAREQPFRGMSAGVSHSVMEATRLGTFAEPLGEPRQPALVEMRVRQVQHVLLQMLELSVRCEVASRAVCSMSVWCLATLATPYGHRTWYSSIIWART